MRPSSRCGICGCRLFCGGGLYWCHSHCLLKDCLCPLPAGPFHWGVIPCIWFVCCKGDLKNWHGRGRVTADSHHDFFFKVSQVLWQQMSTFGAELYNWKASPCLLQSFSSPQAAGAQGSICPLYTLYAWLQPSTLGECHCGNLCGVWFCEPFHWW